MKYLRYGPWILLALALGWGFLEHRKGDKFWDALQKKDIAMAQADGGRATLERRVKAAENRALSSEALTKKLQEFESLSPDPAGFVLRENPEEKIPATRSFVADGLACLSEQARLESERDLCCAGWKEKDNKITAMKKRGRVIRPLLFVGGAVVGILVYKRLKK